MCLYIFKNKLYNNTIMVIHYSQESLEEIISSDDFLSKYDSYKLDNKDKIDDLINFLSSLDVNKRYYKMSVSSKNRTFQNNLSEETQCIKYINNQLNKLTIDNIDLIKTNIHSKILDHKELIPLVIDEIIDICIKQISYIDVYLIILDDILSIQKVDISIQIDKKIELVYIENTYTVDYDSLCKLNKNIDDSIGLSILIIKLELKSLIKGYIIPIIQKMLDNIVLDNDDTVFKYVMSLYNIFKLLDKQYIIINKDKLINLSNEKISKRNKFKIMDILDLV